jgi:uncharacterized membrane protein YadS
VQKYVLGILVCVTIALLAALIAGIPNLLPGIPGIKILGILGWALVLGIALRSSVVLPSTLKTGIGYSAKTILRLGIVLLGVRLNFSSLANSGVLILLLDGLVVLVGIVAVYLRRFGSRGGGQHQQRQR